MYKPLNKFLSVTLLSTSLIGCAAGSDNVFWSASSEGETRQADYASESLDTNTTIANSTSSSGPRYNTAQVSAAAGAALGAGLGAVVGSATGNAVEGLAIGAVAGAASGALVGNEFQKRDDAIEQQREMLARQDETVRAQDRQIQEIRRSLEDRFPTNKPSRNPKVSLDSYRGSPSAKSFAATNSTPRARMDSTTLAPKNVSGGGYASATQPLQRKDSPELARVRPTPVKAVAKPVEKLSAPAPYVAKAPAASTPTPSIQNEKIAKVEPINQPAKVEVTPKQEVARVTPVSEQKPLPIAATTTAQPIAAASQQPAATPATSTVAKMTSAETTGCKEAVDEAQRAEEAVSEADKLFYFRRAARLCPVESNYRVKIGQVYATLGKKEQAKGEFEKALEIDPENVSANEELSLLESNIAY